MPVVPHDRRPRIVSVCLSGFPGSNTALANLSAAANGTRHIVLTTSDPDGSEVKFFQQHFRETRPSLAIFGSWSDAYRPLVGSLAKNGCRIAVYWTSSPGQTGITGELATFARLLEDPVVDDIWFPHRGYAGALGRTHAKCGWLPNVFPPPPRGMSRRRPRRRGAPAHISLFCSPNEAARKNVWCTLLALSGLGRPYHLHLNGLSARQPYSRLLELLKVPFTEHGWMERDQYERTITEMDVGLQISMAESFNFVAADHLLRGVPVLASAMVPVIADLPRAVRQRLVVDRPDDPPAIGRALRVLLGGSGSPALAEAARRALIAANRRALGVAGRVLAARSRRNRR